VPSLAVHVCELLCDTAPAVRSAAAACVVWTFLVAAATPATATAASTRTTGTAIRGFNLRMRIPLIANVNFLTE
jgi:hypothetical protein